MYKYFKWNIKLSQRLVENSENLNIYYFSENGFPIGVATVQGEDPELFEFINSQSPAINCEEITKEECWELLSNSDQIISMYVEAGKLYQKELKIVTFKYTPEERETWSIQTEQANKYLEDNTAEVPLLKQCAEASNMSIQDYANLILNKKAQYEALVSMALSNRQKYVTDKLAEIGL